ncbi:putative Dirigent protein 25 [Cocos nucifera]|uniref:Putative Dirigent protein 25 n=1 Tax=Cocos nucifera TaxID=13894 RepID=A0A8K0IS10_COCNU|nr:putative Dirigent protein 25 [Cocos nucifera]
MEATKVTFEEGRRADSLRFFGVHQLGLSESHIAGVGCTGRHHGANGLGIVKSIGGRENMNRVI